MSSIQAETASRFDTFRRIAVSSIAHPPWFATPVDAREDDDSLTLTFHSPPDAESVRVEVRERSVTVLGGSRTASEPRPMRVCALPYAIETRRIRKARSGELLKVRLLKKRPAREAKPLSVPQ
jgi:HSP20 family molecular chaperone IbpA